MLPDPGQLTLFPTCDTIGEAVRELESRLPIVTPNELLTALMLYHNTVLGSLTPHEIEPTLLTASGGSSL